MAKTLLTNISFVEVNQVRCWAHAVLIEPSDGQPLCDSVRVRGFGTEGAEPIFTLFLATGDGSYTLQPASNDRVIMITDACPEGQPIFRGARLSVGGATLFLQSEDAESPFDVLMIATSASPDETWRTLTRKVAQYWQAPSMPLRQWQSVDAVRRALR